MILVSYLARIGKDSSPWRSEADNFLVMVHYGTGIPATRNEERAAP